jgi:DNA modification methylase
MLIKQNVFKPWALKSKSVQAIITSPPYWGLRKYDIDDVIIGEDDACSHIWGNTGIKGKGGYTAVCSLCGAWKGQYGLEPSHYDYVKHTHMWAEEAWRVLKGDGILFLNIGDSYAGSGGPGSQYDRKNHGYGKHFKKFKNPNRTCIEQNKTKLLIPHKVAIALIECGWILRNDIVWYKPNAMPESTKDRFSKKFEYIFMFTKNQKYYFNLEAVREKCKPLTRWGGHIFKAENDSIWDTGTGQSTYRRREVQPNKGMKNPGDIWSINTKPSKIKHFAMWPDELVNKMILCSTCCNDIILDPFCGSGTTVAAANKLGRFGVGIDLGYHDIASKRIPTL